MGQGPSYMVVSDKAAMVAGMSPTLDPEIYRFCAVPGETLSAALVASCLGVFREAEGVTVIVSDDAAQRFELSGSDAMARIVLNVYSALDGVGLTAAVASALADADIPCNMVAAYHHDHVFVPLPDAERAVAVLGSLQQEAGKVGAA